MQKLLIYILLVLNVLLIGNSHGYDCEQMSATHSSELSKSLMADNHDSQPAPQENGRSGHHCCPVCHAHVAMIFMHKDSATEVTGVKKELTEYSYNDLRSSYLNASPFRPPIA